MTVKSGHIVPDPTPLPVGDGNRPLFGRILVRTFSRRGHTMEYGVIQVIDEGVGIPPEILSRIFEPFFTTKPPNRGTGIGLAVSKYIVEQFRGTIEIESEPGRGTTATIVLPASGCSTGESKTQGSLDECPSTFENLVGR